MEQNVVVAVMEVSAKLKDQTFETVEARVRAAMELTKNHWMAYTEDDRFSAALGASMDSANEWDRRLIEISMIPLKALGAATHGFPVDWETVMAKSDEWLPLMKWWKEIYKSQ